MVLYPPALEGKMKLARLALADGTVFEGRALGAQAENVGEVVFNTSITGYEEILTDPSYAGQIVTMTYPEIGNYGFTELDAQASKALAVGLIVKNACDEPSNWRSQATLDEWLAARGLVGIAGLDTRALVRKLRTEGAQMGVLSTIGTGAIALKEKAKKAAGMEGMDLASAASTTKAYDWTESTPRVLPDEQTPPLPSKFKVTLVDFGVKRGILRQLVDAGCAVRVVPATTTADEILRTKPDGIVLSNGPGDPAAVPNTRPLVQGIVGKVPVMGICLGHQIMALGLGGKTYKLKFGHRGGNHPVFEERTGAVDITAQNHGFAVDASSLQGKAHVTHRSLFDGTVEGLELPEARAFSVQYHPEASPGPSDARHIFTRFTRLMSGESNPA
jgi:carbamoyl-phosphate synthase small subunit